MKKKYIIEDIQLMKEWHYIKNNGLNPDNISSGSDKKVWWICSKGHEWETQVKNRTRGTGCPYCSNQKVLVGYNDLLTINPKLASEWNYKRNIDITPSEFTSFSNKKVWWICSKGHEWEASINGRSKGSNCPYCSNRKILKGFNDLFTTNPELKQEWDYIKNSNLNPDEISYGSEKKANWICSKGHEWKAQISSRTSGYGCPICGRIKSSKNKATPKKGNSVAEKNKDLIQEWDIEKNDLTPFEVNATSPRKIWWKCRVCNYEWEASALTRINGHGCPVCAKKETAKKLSLAPEEKSLYNKNPYILNDWDYEKNIGIDVKKTYATSGKIVWWKCSVCNYEWKASIYDRNNGYGCPNCSSGRRTSFPEKAIYFYIKKYFADAIDNYKDEDLLNVKNLELDIFIPSIKLGIEYDGSLWHKNLKRDLQKDEICAEKGITLIRVREKGLPLLNSSSIIFLLNSDNENELEKNIYLILKYLNIRAPEVNIKSDRIKIYELIKIKLKENSLLNWTNDIDVKWHPIKNGNLKLESFAIKSHKKVWWACSKGHEWESAISNITRGGGCPICSNKKILKGYNDLASRRPDLSSEWDYDKNFPLTPYDVVFRSTKKIWWICKKNHSWKCTVDYRYRKQPICPFCKKEKSNN
ncbi:MAG: zinc-ribbon domain-containing protein [Clostridia bacterium]|nr:zinc-ribbon domain-containing protein [Clostridia bacterium]